MEQPFPESSESKDDSEMPIGSIETDGEAEDVAREDREIQWNRSARNPLNRRREQKWNERCEPENLPSLSLPSAVIGFVAGLGCAILLGVFARSLDNHSSAARDDLPQPCPQDVAMDNEDASDTEDIGFMTSEAGMDQHAQEEAEKLRFETEQHLAQTDEILIWRLDDWRQPLSTFQDMMVQLAGVGTGGGTWVGHEMQRNDPTLEADLLAPHADALAANPSGEPSPVSLDPEAAR